MTGADGSDAERDFARLYAEQQRAIHAYLVGRTGDREAARDLLQEVFLRAWRHVDAWCELPAERQRAWLFTVARNLVIDAHRGRAGADRLSAPRALAGSPVAWMTAVLTWAVTGEIVRDVSGRPIGIGWRSKGQFPL